MKIKPRILHIHVLPVISGSGINTFLTMNNLKDKYAMEMACAPNGGLEDLVKNNKLKFHPIYNFVSEANPLKDLHALYQLYKLIKNGNYDIIHTHNSKGGFLGRLAAKLVSGQKVVHTVHGFSFHENEPFLRRMIFLILEKLAKNWCNMFICISEPLIDMCEEHNICKRERITKIYSGIDIDDFNKNANRALARKQFGIKDNEIAIGQVSKLWEGKGHEDIINSAYMIFEKVPNARIFFIGDGPISDKLINLVESKKLSNKIIFWGHTNNVPFATSALDIGILASHFEGMGRVILEAMTLGLPVVACNVGGIPDLIINNQTGILIPPHSPIDIANAVIKLCSNAQLRKEMGANALKSVGERFSLNTMISQIDEVYTKLLENTNLN